MKKNHDEQLSDKEIERRMTGAIQRALNTPPKPFTPPAKGKGKKKSKPKKRGTA